MNPLCSPILDAAGDVRVAFLDRDDGAGDDLERAQARLVRVLGTRAPGRAVENRQIHSATVVHAVVGGRVEADALHTSERDLALAVYTADCVPVLLGGPAAIAAVHAGWRGLEARVIERAVRALPDAPSVLTAWIGPAMAGCCYEVGEDVACRVAVAAGAAVKIDRRGRPHLDLPGAARAQLVELGVEDVRLLAHCTGCEPERFWSYRRHGATGRRNYALVWRAAAR